MPAHPPIERRLLDRERRRAFRWWRLRSLPRRFYLELLRAIRAASRASALFLTIAGVLISAVGLTLSLGGRPLPGGWAAFASLLAILVLAFLASGLSVLRMLPAEELARLLVHGRSTGEILETIGLRIHRLARRFVGETGKAPDLPLRLLKACESPGTDRDGLVREARRTLRAIDRLCQAEDVNFRRIGALKREAARELHLSQRSLGDHLLQFSPAMFRAGVTRYVRSLHEMIELTLAADFEEADGSRFRGLIEQNRRLEEDCRDRATIQELLVRFEDLHADVCSLASTRSTSGSLQAYSRALAGLAKRQRKRLGARSWRRGWGLWSGSVEDSAYIETYERFLFLYRRQRAHPGFDLHSLLTQAVDGMAAPPLCTHFDQQVVGYLRTTLRAMEWPSGPLARRAPAGPGEDNPKHRARYLARLEGVCQIHRYFNRAVSLSREAMRSPFCEVLDAWCARLAAGAFHYVVTIGYSKTVRDLIRAGFGPPDDRQGASKPRPLLYQLLAGDQDELDTRLMTWELRDLRLGEPLRLAAGSGEMLASLTRPRDRVLVLLGAEAVDSERRVVHPRSVLDRLLPAVEKLTANGVPVLVVVAAEAYKRHGSPFLGGSLYRGQFDRVGIYDAMLIDMVVSDGGIDPPQWRRVVRKRLHLHRP
jgi:hypothetical protein